MSEPCVSSCPYVSTILLSDLHLSLSFLLSHPLYLSYFVFFSPYLLKLISFLYPLFLTTFLLTTLSPLQLSSDSKLFCLSSSFHHLTERLWIAEEIERDQDISLFDEIEAYTSVFGTSQFEERANVYEEVSDESCVSKESLLTVIDPETAKSATEEEECMELESFFKDELDDFETRVDDKEVRGESESNSSQRHETDFSGDDVNAGESKPESNLVSHGSMRREREWRRTLACKLFEERHSSNNSDGNGGGNSEEEMDMLWERYDADTETKESGNCKKKIENHIIKCYDWEGNEKDEEEEEEEEEEEDMDDDGKLCCLQALKYSAGKMNLGMKKPSLTKICKAIKGIGWLHRVTKHSKSKRKKATVN